MRLQEVRIEGYRCLEDVTVGFGALTTLLGSNSTGKSSVLKALRFFFEGEALTIDDVFSQREDDYVSVQATFDNLSPADCDVFGVYALGEQMVLRRAWQDGSIKLTGRGLRYPVLRLFVRCRAFRDELRIRRCEPNSQSWIFRMSRGSTKRILRC